MAHYRKHKCVKFCHKAQYRNVETNYMYYAKTKREKYSICNLCRKKKDLSWDHVPPKGGIELSAVRMETIFQLMTGDKDKPKPRESQNGMKFRTICSDCNSLLGTEYDPTMNDFAISVGRYLNSQLQFPGSINHRVKPQRLMKALLGHLIAAKVDIENTSFDRQAREYVLDIDAPLPANINIFYWVFPHECSIAIRDFAMFTPRGTFDQPAIFQTLKYFPVAYLCCDKAEYAGLQCLSWYRDLGIDDELEIPINLKRIEHPFWPEAPSDKDNNIFFGGRSASNAVQAIPKR